MKNDQLLHVRAQLSNDLFKFLHIELCQKIVSKKVKEKSGKWKKSVFTREQLKELKKLENEVQKKIKAIKEFDLLRTADHEIYFRKFNALHGYIDKHIAMGNQMEDQDDVLISPEQIEKLQLVVEEINKGLQAFVKKSEELNDVKVVLDENDELTEEAQQKLDEIGSYLPLELAEKTFPTTDGPFFGELEYGEFYFSDLERLVEFLNKSKKKWQSPDYLMVYMMYY